LPAEDRIREVHALAESSCLAVDNTLSVALMRIPKKVRTMAMSRFIEEHAGDVHKALFAELTKYASF